MQEVSKYRYSVVYLLGDINLDHSPKKQDETALALETSLKSYGCEQLISAPTRQIMTTSSLINVLYIKTAQKTSLFIVKSSLSDHYMIGCVKFLDYQPYETTTFIGRSYKKYSREEAIKFYDLHDKSCTT